jgi:hypothetical protein
MLVRFITMLGLFLLILPGRGAAQTVPPNLIAWWEANAPRCRAPDGFQYPGKISSTDDCDDGDINLFAGLLCASGEPIGCETVRRSQTTEGKWFRSPRRAQTDNLGLPNSFSPDMALGTELYLAMSRSSAAGSAWLSWMNRVRPCLIGSGDDCLQSPLLRFCTNDDESGCTVRPGDASMLDATARYVPLTVPTEDIDHLFHQAGINMLDMLWASAQLNQAGYSQHLVAAQILLLRRMGYTDDRLKAAAAILASRQPRNPFFAFLHEGRTANVLNLTLEQCPSPQTGLPRDRTQWAWEREDAENAWRRSMVWDCIFMARLLQGA